MNIKICFKNKIFLIDLDDLKRKIISIRKERLKENGGVGSGIKGHTTPKEESEKDKQRQNLFGKEYIGYKGREAINILMQEKQVRYAEIEI